MISSCIVYLNIIYTLMISKLTSLTQTSTIKSRLIYLTVHLTRTYFSNSHLNLSNILQLSSDFFFWQKKWHFKKSSSSQLMTSSFHYQNKIYGVISDPSMTISHTSVSKCVTCLIVISRILAFLSPLLWPFWVIPYYLQLECLPYSQK